MSILMAKLFQSTKYLKGWRKNGSHKHTCTPVAYSYWCMAKPIQYCKVIYLQLKYINLYLKNNNNYTCCLYTDRCTHACTHTHTHTHPSSSSLPRLTPLFTQLTLTVTHGKEHDFSQDEILFLSHNLDLLLTLSH